MAFDLNAAYGFNKPSGFTDAPQPGMRRPMPQPLGLAPPPGMAGSPGFPSPGGLPVPPQYQIAGQQGLPVPPQFQPAQGGLPTPPQYHTATGGLPVPPQYQPAGGGIPAPPQPLTPAGPAMQSHIMDGTAPGAHAMMTLRRMTSPVRPPNLDDLYGFNKPSGWNYGR